MEYSQCTNTVCSRIERWQRQCSSSREKRTTTELFTDAVNERLNRSSAYRMGDSPSSVRLDVIVPRNERTSERADSESPPTPHVRMHEHHQHVHSYRARIACTTRCHNNMRYTIYAVAPNHPAAVVVVCACVSCSCCLEYFVFARACSNARTTHDVDDDNDDDEDGDSDEDGSSTTGRRSNQSACAS